MPEVREESGLAFGIARFDETAEVTTCAFNQPGERPTNRGCVADGESRSEETGNFPGLTILPERADAGERVLSERPLERKAAVKFPKMIGELRSRLMARFHDHDEVGYAYTVSPPKGGASRREMN